MFFFSWPNCKKVSSALKKLEENEFSFSYFFRPEYTLEKKFLLLQKDTCTINSSIVNAEGTKFVNVSSGY